VASPRQRERAKEGFRARWPNGNAQQTWPDLTLFEVITRAARRIASIRMMEKADRMS